MKRVLYYNLLFCFLLSFSCKNKKTLDDPLQAGWKGEKVCTIIEENDKVRVLKCVFPPNIGHEKHYHPAHFGYTLQGGKFKITDATGTREVNVPKDYHFYNERIEWHQVLNIGDSTAVFILIEPK